MIEKTEIVPKRQDLAEPDHIRFDPKVRRRILEISEETGQGFAAAVRLLVDAGLRLYEKAQR